MKHSKIFSNMMLAGLSLALMIFFTPLSFAANDKDAEKAEYQRKVDHQIQDLQRKIEQAREDYKEEGRRVEQKIQGYQDRMDEVRREAEAEMADKSRKPADKDQSRIEREGRLAKLRRDFNEWRLKRAINSYDEKIQDLRWKAKNEQNPDRKRNLEERIQKLDAKYNAANAKLNDLRATDGENWDRIEAELDASLKEIDRDYEEARQGDMNDMNERKMNNRGRNNRGDVDELP